MQAKPLSTASVGGTVSLRVLIPFLALFGAGLYAIVGLPHTPNPSIAIPDPTSLEALLRSSHPPLDGAIYLIGMVGWGVWGWLIVSLLLQLLAAGAERIAAGATAVRRLRTIADVLSVPLVRRAVQTSLAGSMVVRVALAGVPTAAAAAPQDHSVVVTVVSTQTSVAASSRADTWATSEVPADDIPAGSLIYTVQPGDNLARIAERFYADGDQWQVLYEANQGRRMQDGATFDRAGVIHPGWRLIVPEPSEAIHTDADGRRWYTVRKGDSLAGISAQLLGDEQRWPELFATNQGVRLDDGHVLTNPRLIWPGLLLELPGLDSPAGSPNQPEAAAPAPAPSPPAPPQPTAPSPPPAPVTDVAPTAPAAIPTAAPTAVPTEVALEEPRQPDQQGGQQLPSWTLEAAGATAGVALLGLGLAGAGRSRRRRSPWDETDIQVAGGFAQATGDETAYEGPAATLADQVLAFVRQQGCSSAQLLGAYAGRTGAGLLLTMDPEQTEHLTTAAAVFSSDAKAARLKTNDVGHYQWEQTWASVRPRPVGSGEDASVRLMPIGLAGDHRVLYVDRSEAGALLIAGQAFSGVHELLAAVVIDRARRQRPDQLYLLTVARRGRLDPLLADLPHQRAGFVDPGDSAAVNAVLVEVRSELERRLQHGQGDSPELLLVVDEWAEVVEAGPVLDLLARHGPTVGISLVAATTRVDDETAERWVGLFGTRLVLQTPDETSSVQLLGEAGAEDLDGVGQLLPWVRGRVLHRVRGFRVPPLHLADLVERMRERTQPNPVQPAATPEDLASDTGREDQSDEHAQAERHVPLAPSAGWPDSNGTAHSSAPAPSLLGETPESRQSASVEMEESATSTLNGAAHQLALIGPVALTREYAVVDELSVSPDNPAGVAKPEPLVELRLFGTQTSLVRGEEIPLQRFLKYRQGWSTLLAIAALPEGKASTSKIGALLWPASHDDEDKVINRIQANLSNVRRVLQECGLTEAEARELVRTESGMCLLNRDAVQVDVWEFIDAERTGNFTRVRPGHTAETIAAYQRARGLYAGPLLHQQDATHPWVGERIDGILTLRETYHSQYQAIGERLAELLIGADRYVEATSVYRELLCDPFALPSRERDVLEARQAHARALFGCCRVLRDADALEQALRDLHATLERDDAEGGASTPSQPTAETLALFDEVHQALSANLVSSRS